MEFLSLVTTRSKAPPEGNTCMCLYGNMTYFDNGKAMLTKKDNSVAGHHSHPKGKTGPQ